MRIIIRKSEDNTGDLGGSIQVFTDIKVLKYDAVNETLSFIINPAILYVVYIDAELTKKAFGYNPADIVSDPYFFRSHDDLFVVGNVHIVPNDYDDEYDEEDDDEDEDED